MRDGNLHIELFGKFRMEYGGETVTKINKPRLQELLTYLLLNCDSPQSRKYISFQFWPESSEKQARTNLRNLLYKLRKVLPDHERYLLTDHKTLQWNVRTAYSLDVEEFEVSIKKAEEAKSNGSVRQQISLLEQAVNIYKGELLVTCYKKWIEPERNRLQQECQTVLKKLTRILEKERDYQKAIPFARKLLEYDPFEEAVYRRLMRLYALNDERAKAVETYVKCSDVLQEELGIAPSEETRKLYNNLFSIEKKEEKRLPYIRGSQEEWPFIGRREEWEQLLKIWKPVLAGDSRFLLIEGEPGIGKSRLGNELKKYLEKQGYQSIYTRLYASAENVSLGLAIDCLREKSVYRQVKEMDSVWLKELVRILPEIKIDHPEISDPEPIDKPEKQSRFLSTVSEVFLHDGKPKLLFLDDLQWCDPESLEWISCLLHHPKSSNILVAGSVRPVEAEKNRPLQKFISMIKQEGRMDEIVLEPLKKGETKELAEVITERKIDKDLETLIYRETEGNPLFVVEFMREERFRKMFDGAVAKPPHDKELRFPDLPKRVEAVIAARFQYLSDQAWELMCLAATIGRRFSSEILAEASIMDEIEVLDGLDELLRHQIIREHNRATFDFTHDKLREVAYNQISETRRRFNHRRIAHALEEKRVSEDEAYYSALAYHCKRGGEIKKAILFNEKAAVKAKSMFSKRDIEFYKKALKLLDELPENEERVRKERSLRMGLVFSLSNLKIQKPKEIFFSCKKIRELSHRLKESPPAEVLFTLAFGYVYIGNLRRAENVAQEMLQLSEENEDMVAQIASLHILGFKQYLTGNMIKSRELLEKGLHNIDPEMSAEFVKRFGQELDLLLQIGLDSISCLEGYRGVDQKEIYNKNTDNIHTEVFLSHWKTWVKHLEGNIEETIKLAEEFLSSKPDQIPTFWHLQRRVFLGWALVRDGKMEEGIQQMKQGIQILEKQGITLSLPYYYIMLADVQIEAGKLEDAETALQRANELKDNTGECWFEPEFCRFKGIILLNDGSGDRGEAEQWFQKGLEISRQMGTELFEKRILSTMSEMNMDNSDL